MRTTSLALALVALAALAPASNAAISGPLVDWFTEAQKAVVAYGIPNQLSAKVSGAGTIQHDHTLGRVGPHADACINDGPAQQEPRRRWTATRTLRTLPQPCTIQ